MAVVPCFGDRDHDPLTGASRSYLSLEFFIRLILLLLSLILIQTSDLGKKNMEIAKISNYCCGYR